VKRWSLVLSVLLAVALVVPSVAMATDPVFLTPWDAPDPVPANTPLCVPGGWMTMTRGIAMSAPTFLKWYFTVWDEQNEVVAQCTTADSDQYWVPGVLLITADDSESVPFNSHIGAKQYVKDWRYMIPEGLPAGHYHMVGGVVQTRIAFDLYWYYEGQRSPMPLEAGDFQIVDWEFDVE